MKSYFRILVILLTVSSTVLASNIISINFYKDDGGVTYGKINSNSFGVALEDSVTDGWIDKLSDVHKGYALTTADGVLSSVIMQTIRPNLNGYDSTDADNYAQTAMRGYINAYTNNGNHAQVILDNLNVNYPNGYKIITYLGGANQNSGASISLTEGDASSWDASTDDTYYFKTRYYPDPSSETQYSGSATSDAPSTIYVGNGTFSPPYYFFYEDANATIPLDITDQIFYKGNTYTFERVSGVNNHPFYISDIPVNGSYHYGNLSFSPSQGTSSGIVSGEQLTFTIPSGTYTNELHYYCTIPNHSSMVSANGLEIGQINSIAGWDGTPVKATDTTSDVGANTTVADYAVFDNLSADKITLTVDSIQGGAAGLGGVQIIGLNTQPVAGTPKVLSVNLVSDTNAPNQAVSATYGLAEFDSEVAGWHNVISPTTGTNNYFTFSDGNTYPVQVTGFRPNGNGFDNADNSPGAANDANDTSGSDSDNYDGTPLRGYAKANKPYNDEVHVTLNNLNSTFPNGIKVIAYLGGPSANLGARVRLSEGGSANDTADGWLSNENNLGTYFYKTRWNPDAPSQPAGFNGTLIRATSTDTTLLDATSGANLPVADYAVWENVTADKITITVDALTINDSQQAAGLSGFQIIEEGATIPAADPEYTTWLTANSLASGSENNDADNDGVVNILEYAYGSNPNIDEGVEHVTGGVISGNLTLSHPVRAGLDHGLSYTVETTDDLKFGTWTSTGVTVSDINTSGVLDQITHSVSSTNDAVFLRLKVNVE